MMEEERRKGAKERKEREMEVSSDRRKGVGKCGEYDGRRVGGREQEKTG